MLNFFLFILLLLIKGFWIKELHEGSPCVSAHSKLNVCADSYKIIFPRHCTFVLVHVVVNFYFS